MFSKHSIPAWLWTAIVSLLCGLPGYTFPKLDIWAIISFDGAAHAFVFAVFSYLWAVALYKERSALVRRAGPPERKSFFRAGLWVPLVFGIGYGIFIELMQYAIFVRRAAEWTDMVADAIGAGVGVIVFRWIYRPILKHITAGKLNGSEGVVSS